MIRTVVLLTDPVLAVVFGPVTGLAVASDTGTLLNGTLVPQAANMHAKPKVINKFFIQLLPKLILEIGSPTGLPDITIAAIESRFDSPV